MPFELQFSRDELPALASRYDFDDDSEQREAGEKARGRGHYTKRELVLLCRWKTTRSTRLVAENTAEFVKAMTGAALATENERERLAALTALRGVHIPTASVLLHFAFPRRYPIIDWRALESLGQNRGQPCPFRYWLSYVDECQNLAAETGLSMRELDKALWQWSKEHGTPPT